MQVQLFAVLVLCSTLVRCYPDDPCAGDLAFDEVNALCYTCPADSTFKAGTCQCMEGYDYVQHQCVLMDGAMPPMPDAGPAAMSDGSVGDGSMGDAETAYAMSGTCQDYCAFANVCIASNDLAKSYLADVITGLHADDTAACKSSCQQDVGSNESKDSALACIKESQAQAKCVDPDPQKGLGVVFGVFGSCCGPVPDSALCKSICKPLKANGLTSAMVPFCP